jgi:hypothetical protein
LCTVDPFTSFLSLHDVRACALNSDPSHAAVPTMIHALEASIDTLATQPPACLTIPRCNQRLQQTTGKRHKDVDGKRKFPEVLGFLEAKIDAALDSTVKKLSALVGTGTALTTAGSARCASDTRWRGQRLGDGGGTLFVLSSELQLPPLTHTVLQLACAALTVVRAPLFFFGCHCLMSVCRRFLLSACTQRRTVAST